jgi:hypothetical protein
MRKRARENPLSMGKPEKIAIGVGLAAGIATAIYFVSKPAQASPATPAIVPDTAVLQPGAQSLTMHVGVPLVLALPTGAVWGASVANAGTATPITIPAPIAADLNQTAPIPAIPWVDSTGAAQSTTLTLTVKAVGVAGSGKLALQKEVVRNLGVPQVPAPKADTETFTVCQFGKPSDNCPPHTFVTHRRQQQ